MATPVTSRGIASRQPSVMGASASSSCADELRHAAILWVGQDCAKWAAVAPLLESGQELENKRAWQISPTPSKTSSRAGRFVITAEITPPASFDAADLFAKAMPLKGLADAVNVTDGAGARAHLGAVTAAGCCCRTASSRSCSSHAGTATASRCKAT